MKTKHWLIIISVLLIIFVVREGCNQKTTDNLIQDITSYSDSAKFERLKNGALISVNTSLKLQSQDQLRVLASNLGDTVKQMFDKFKSVNSVTYVTNQFFTGKDTIKFETKIPCSFPPFKVRREVSKSYKFVGTIGQDYFAIDSLSVPDSMTIIHGRKKVSFLKYDHVVAINHSNPLMITTNITDLKYDPKKKWYERTWVHALGGIIIYQGVKSGGQAVINSYLKR